jgi:hypothetical protein
MLERFVEISVLCICIVLYVTLLALYFKYAMCDDFIKGLLYFLGAVLGGFYLIVLTVAFFKGGFFLFFDAEQEVDEYLKRVVKATVIKPVAPTKVDDQKAYAVASALIGVVIGAAFAVVIFGIRYIKNG